MQGRHGASEGSWAGLAAEGRGQPTVSRGLTQKCCLRTSAVNFLFHIVST